MGNLKTIAGRIVDRIIDDLDERSAFAWCDEIDVNARNKIEEIWIEIIIKEFENGTPTQNN